MKITDISTSTPVPEQAKQEQTTEQYERTKKRSLLDRFNIPIDHLDFSYVKNCTDAREVDRILRILRSGEEGTYLELERCVEARLEQLNPNSRSLRVETPAVRTRELLRDEREALENGLEEWLNDVSKLNKESLSSRKSRSSDIFNDGTDDAVFPSTECPLPVRGSAAAADYKVGTKETSSKNVKSSKTSKKSGESRIKSWEYDKWDKFDIDAELTKLDIVDMQREEWEKREKPKILEEQRKVEKLMKSSEDINVDKNLMGKSTKSASSSSASTNKTQKAEISLHKQQSEKKVKPRVPIETKSFIEEINDDDDDDEAGESVNTSSVLKSYGSRRTTVVIEDLNLATK